MSLLLLGVGLVLTKRRSLRDIHRTGAHGKKIYITTMCCFPVRAALQNRLWRKNRSMRDNDTGCVGVDLNRNWDAKWEGEAKKGEYRQTTALVT